VEFYTSPNKAPELSSADIKYGIDLKMNLTNSLLGCVCCYSPPSKI